MIFNVEMIVMAEKENSCFSKRQKTSIKVGKVEKRVTKIK